MSISKDNVVIHGFSGKFGPLIVFRQRAGKTLAHPPAKEKTGVPSEKQLAHMKRFQQAVLYGKKVMADPSVKKEYQAAAEADETAYNVALADYFHAPDIEEVNISAYTGQPGQPIKILASDNFKVKAASVAIYNDDGGLVEEGAAAKEPEGVYWIYTTTADNPVLTGDRIVITVTDNPDNLTTDEKILQ